jgi:hypothetical protein
VSALDRATLLAVRAWVDQQVEAAPVAAADPDLLMALKGVISILINNPDRRMTCAESDAFWAGVVAINKAELQ